MDTESSAPNITIVGIGATGLQVIKRLAEPDACYDVADTTDNRLMACRFGGGVTHGGPDDGFESIFRQIEGTDLVFVVAGFADACSDIAVRFCREAYERFIKPVLVISEPEEQKLRRGTVACKRNGNYDHYNAAFPPQAVKILNYIRGMVVVSAASLRCADASRFCSADGFMPYLISDIITKLIHLPDSSAFGDVSVQDLRRIVTSGVTRCGIGFVAGETRAVAAAEQAIISLQHQGVRLDHASGFVCIVSGSGVMTMEDFEYITSAVCSKTDGDDEGIISVFIDESLGDSLMVTLLITESYFDDIPASWSKSQQQWIVEGNDTLRTIPAFERKKWH